jgi:phospholipid/cholesterol/gamma-HCH transport system ATP-binding protein
MIANYRKRFGFTAVLISHDIPDVFFISDRIVLLWEGKVAFQGSYEEMSKLDHPMIEEFLTSLEGFQDELTGLLSKQTFRSRYASTLSRGQQESTVTAVLFCVEIEKLTTELGHSVTAEIVKSLGEYISNHLDALGGFSTRHRPDQILTIMPYANHEEAETMLKDFAMGLEQQGLPRFIRKSRRRFSVPACFDIKVFAGVVPATSNEEIDGIIERARAEEHIIAQYRCNEGGIA